jgi:Protein of unknown function (DUF433)
VEDETREFLFPDAVSEAQKLALPLVSSGMTDDEILAGYTDLQRDDLLAALAYAARLSDAKRIALGLMNFLVEGQLPRGWRVMRGRRSLSRGSRVGEEILRSLASAPRTQRHQPGRGGRL